MRGRDSNLGLRVERIIIECFFVLTLISALSEVAATTLALPFVRARPMD